MRDVVLFQTHVLSTAIRETFDRLRAETPDGMDAVLLFDTGAGQEPPADLAGDAWTYDGAELAAEVGRRGLRGGYTNLPALAFHRSHPDYARYWMIEFDVRFTGPWPLLFDHFADAPEDLLAAEVRGYRSDPTWYWWDKPMETPGEAVEMDERVAAFLPICRYSGDALRLIGERYARGWRAHSEILVPTALHREGLTLRDFGGSGEWVAPGDRNRFYVGERGKAPEAEGGAPVTLRWMPPFPSAGRFENKLYHPVKPERPPPEWLKRFVASRSER